MPSGASGGYVLLGSYPTVQVLSPSLINDVVYCTIQTQPSHVVASIPVQEDVFNQGAAGSELSNFAQGIEAVMALPHVTAAVGDQTIDQSGLIADNVVFTVTYTDPVNAPYGATAQVLIGARRLDFTDALIGRTLLAGVTADIDAAYANLKAAAGG